MPRASPWPAACAAPAPGARRWRPGGRPSPAAATSRCAASPSTCAPTSDGPVLATLDRGAIPAFGVMAQGVHLNGLVRRADGLHVWVGVRATDKAVAPGQLDHVVAGGIPAGLGPRNAWSRKRPRKPPCRRNSPPGRGRPAGFLLMRQRRGPAARRAACLRPGDPRGLHARPGDDEVERFELWPAPRLLEAVRDTDRSSST